MSRKTLCRLCISSCNTFKSLFNDNGEVTEIFKIANKYFDDLLNPDIKNSSTVICIECWQYINDFYTFQQSVLKSQAHLEYQQPIIRLVRLEEDDQFNMYLNTNKGLLSSYAKKPTAPISVFDIVEINGKQEIDFKTLETIQQTTDPVEQYKSNSIESNATANIYYADERTRKNDDFIAKWKGKLECVICNNIFPNFSTLHQHFLIQHPLEKCHIKCCGNKLDARWKIAKHIRKYHDFRLRLVRKLKYKCDKCEKLFDHSRSLNKHMRVKHTDSFKSRHSQSYQCKFCRAKFSLEDRLKKHILKKHTEKQLTTNNFENYGNNVNSTNKSITLVKSQSHQDSGYQINYEDSMSSIVSNGIEMHNFILEKCQERGEKSLTVPNNISNLTLQQFKENEIHVQNDEIHIQNNSQGKEQIVNTTNDISNCYLIPNIDDFLEQSLEVPNDDNNQMLEEFQEIEKHITINRNKIAMSLAALDGGDGGNIPMPPLDIVDVKPEFPLCSDTESEFETNEKISKLNDFFARISSISTREKRLEYDDYIKNWKENLPCPICNEMFNNFSLISSHFHLKHPGETIHIVCCQIKLCNRFQIVEHLRLHIDPKAYQCNICYKCCDTMRYLGKHKKDHHPQQPAEFNNNDQYLLCQCETSTELNTSNNAICCERKRNMLQNDEIIAKWLGELICAECHGQFSTYSLLQQHYASHHPTSTFSIVCCQRSFFKLKDAVEHIRLHLNPDAYKCQICNGTFNGKRSLSHHLRSQHNEKLLHCDQCNKSFLVDYTLKRHKKMYHN